MQTQRGRNRTMVIIVTLSVLAVLITAGTLGYFWYRKTHPTAEDTTSGGNGGSISLNSPAKLETETIQTAMLVPSSTNKVGDSVRLSALSITVPKAWRTVNAKNLLNTPLESVYATSTNDILTQLIMVPETAPTDPVQATNSFGLYNITSWLSKPTQTNNGTVTPAAKTAFVQNIANIGDGKTPSKTVCAPGHGLFSTTICGPMVSQQAITTSDGVLKGVAFIGTTAQTATYDPTAIVFLTGKIKDQQVFAYGAFHLLDNNSHNLSATDAAALKTAWDAVLGGTVPSDTVQLYQHVVGAIKSITIQAN